MILKKNLSFAASIIKLIIMFFFCLNSNADENNSKYFSKDLGTISLMYHRFNENKYPSTNIQMDIFKKQIELIRSKNLKIESPKNFELNFNNPKVEKKILITIDDAFSSFYKNAWPYLKENKIPFLLFISSDAVGKHGYMNWDEIKEVEKEDFAFIGNHSHSHDYLVNFEFKKFQKDIDNSIKIFQEKIGYNPIYFSYPFGEYNLNQKEYIRKKFKFAFGQHSGVIDFNKDKYELPRFPINEKYGDLDRFSFVISLFPLQYKNVKPINKFISNNNNPPEMIIEFFDEQQNLKKINCFSNEGDKWDKSKIKLDNNKLIIEFRDKFIFRRGRVNCSLKDDIGWRWLGFQFTIESTN